MRDGIIHGLSADIIRAVRVRRMSVPVAEAEFIRAVCTSESSRLVRFSHALMQPRWSQVQRRAVAYVVNDSNQEFTILTSLMPRPLIDAALDTSVQGPALRDTCSVPSLNAAHPRTQGSTLLHFAVTHMAHRCTRSLLRSGASPLVTLASGATPLHMACARKSAYLAQQLLAAGASVTARSLQSASSLAVSDIPNMGGWPEASRTCRTRP